MNVQQRNAILQMTVSAGQIGLDRDSFIEATGISNPEDWALLELKQALVDESAENVQFAIILGSRLVIDSAWTKSLINVLEVDWSYSHEDAAESLGELADPQAVPALRRAATWVPAYLDYDEGRALAKKAIYALGKIPGADAALALDDLRRHEDRPLRDWVESVIEQRSSSEG